MHHKYVISNMRDLERMMRYSRVVTSRGTHLGRSDCRFARPDVCTSITTRQMRIISPTRHPQSRCNDETRGKHVPELPECGSDVARVWLSYLIRTRFGIDATILESAG
jgi:hypothetical protein